MLNLGVLLSSKIEEAIIAGKKIWDVEDGYLIACFKKSNMIESSFEPIVITFFKKPTDLGKSNIFYHNRFK